jgi:hypothetical protein
MEEIPTKLSVCWPNTYFKSLSILEDPEFKGLHASVQVLFDRLCWLRQKFGRETADNVFWRPDQALAKDCGCSLNTMKDGRRRLILGGWIAVMVPLHGRRARIPHYYVLDDVYEAHEERRFMLKERFSHLDCELDEIFKT